MTNKYELRQSVILEAEIEVLRNRLIELKEENKKLKNEIEDIKKTFALDNRNNKIIEKQ